MFKRHTAKEIGEFRRLELHQQTIRSVLATGSSNNRSKSVNHCFWSYLSVFKEHIYSNSYVSIELGYENIIRESVYRRTGIMCDNIHNRFFIKTDIGLN